MSLHRTQTTTKEEEKGKEDEKFLMNHSVRLLIIDQYVTEKEEKKKKRGRQVLSLSFSLQFYASSIISLWTYYDFVRLSLYQVVER